MLVSYAVYHGTVSLVDECKSRNVIDMSSPPYNDTYTHEMKVDPSPSTRETNDHTDWFRSGQAHKGVGAVELQRE